MLNTNTNYAGYLFVHFIGEQPEGEQVYFSYSEDGLHWKDLNGGKPVLRSNLGEQGVRDPFLIRSAKEDKFYLIATDLRIANGKGWGVAVNEGSRDIVVWESSNLIDWSSPWTVTLGTPGAGCVWAPEAVYDEAADEFLVFWASATQDADESERKQKIYSAHTKDFRTFTPSEKYIERENHIIDTTILASSGSYYRYSKDETTDPDVAKFGDRYYMYPTTDGFDGWSGTQFKVFSSSDLQYWQDEGIILDLATDNVPWAIGNAWAPAIASRNNKYYYYFCGKMPNQESAIGVAVAHSPTGPFQAEPEPLITMDQLRRLGITMGQAIDPSIYAEQDGKMYLLFGNGDAAIVELGDDMITVREETMRNLAGLHDFREAVTVLKQDGLYHFTWSCDDTGSEDYHVNYGTSESLYGPVTYHYPVLSKNVEKDMLGTGHHCIFHDSETNQYHMAYHRFVTPLSRFSEGKGYHREVCIDPIQFGADGRMKPVVL